MKKSINKQCRDCRRMGAVHNGVTVDYYCMDQNVNLGIGHKMSPYYSACPLFQESTSEFIRTFKENNPIQAPRINEQIRRSDL